MVKTRKEVGLIFGDQPSFDSTAFKFFILYLNKIQYEFEFFFPDTEGYLLNKDSYTVDDLSDIYSSKIVPLRNIADYWVVVISNGIVGKFFSYTSSEVTFISTKDYEKYFSPPSLFEYLLAEIITGLIFMESGNSIDFHYDTRGSIFDLKRKKEDIKVSLLLGYLPNSDKLILLKTCSPPFIETMEMLLRKEWIGKIDEHGSVAYNLKHSFRYDINKESGFNKTRFEKVKKKLEDVPIEIFKSILELLIALVLAYLLYRLGINS